PPFSIEVTLYGATEKTYERITGVPGSYERCLRGIRLLQSRGLPLKLKTVVLQSNRHELEAMQHLAENELGLEFKYDAGINPRLDFSLAPLAERLTPDEIVALDRCDSRRMQEWQSFADRFTGPAQAAGHENDLYHCGAGISEFAIDSDGRLSLCAFASEETWDLHTGSFREGWDSVIHAVRNKKISKQTKCTDCGLKAMCGMCPANAQLENGEPEQPVDFLCRVAHLRAEALGISVPEHGECEYCNHT
ncbi:MAG: radical SAM protein, partial [Deltaproteobacteria bacterium]|nr:radical SAM protein [Deltaproteobacteria bacterium]